MHIRFRSVFGLMEFLRNFNGFIHHIERIKYFNFISVWGGCLQYDMFNLIDSHLKEASSNHNGAMNENIWIRIELKAHTWGSNFIYSREICSLPITLLGIYLQDNLVIVIVRYLPRSIKSSSQLKGKDLSFIPKVRYMWCPTFSDFKKEKKVLDILRHIDLPIVSPS